MSSAPSYQNPEFDEFADSYDEALQQGLSVSGERKEFFAHGRVAWLQHRLQALSFLPKRVLDFGCGTGTAAPFLLALAGLEELIGVEVSAKSLVVARRLHGGPKAGFHLNTEFEPQGTIDLVYCSGVFHHIPLTERAGAVRYLFQALRPGGILALFENNPWNPGTRYIMSRIPFDRDAIPLAPPATKQLLRAGGFEIAGVDFLFFFPARLRALRFAERFLAKVPLGAQYQVLAVRPS